MEKIWDFIETNNQSNLEILYIIYFFLIHFAEHFPIKNFILTLQKNKDIINNYTNQKSLNLNSKNNYINNF